MKNLKLDEFPNWLKQKGNIRKHSRWNMGVYLVEDVNFSKEGYDSDKNVNNCVNAIKELLTNQSLYNNIQKNARLSVINKFSENIKKNDEITIYRMILNKINIVKNIYY